MSTPDPDDTVELVIRCPKCQGAKPGRPEAVEYRDPACPKWLVSGMLIAFHSNHEGHQLEVEVDGRLYAAPS